MGGMEVERRVEVRYLALQRASDSIKHRIPDRKVKGFVVAAKVNKWIT